MLVVEPLAATFITWNPTEVLPTLTRSPRANELMVFETVLIASRASAVVKSVLVSPAFVVLTSTVTVFNPTFEIA